MRILIDTHLVPWSWATRPSSREKFALARCGRAFRMRGVHLETGNLSLVVSFKSSVSGSPGAERNFPARF